MKRIPHLIQVRCRFNGAETTALLYLKRKSDALAVMRRYVPQRERDAIRLMYCRPATDNEVLAHRARIGRNAA